MLSKQEPFFAEIPNRRGCVLRLVCERIAGKVAAGGSGQVYKGEFDGACVAVKELFAVLMDSFDVSVNPLLILYVAP